MTEPGKITDVRGYFLSSPYGDGDVFGQPLGVKSLGIIEVHTSNNFVGIGETYCGVYSPELISPIVDFVKPIILGEDLCCIEDLYEKMSFPVVGSTGIIRSVIGAIEIALWDILGQYKGKPIHQLLSDSLYPVKAYASGGSVTFGADEIEAEIESIKEEGHTGYKMRVGLSSWEDDLTRVNAAMENPPNDLMLDCIMGTLNKWDLDTARECLLDLCRFHPTWVEEPLDPNDISGIMELADQVDVPIAIGETLSEVEMCNYINCSNISYIQPDVTQCGGFLSAIRVIERARLKGIKVSLHVWGSAISQIANLHLALAIGVDFYEVPLVNLQISDHLVQKPKIESGILKPNLSECGLGVKLTGNLKDAYTGVKGSGYKVGHRLRSY